jgi:hypothetical protein
MKFILLMKLFIASCALAEAPISKIAESELYKQHALPAVTMKREQRVRSVVGKVDEYYGAHVLEVRVCADGLDEEQRQRFIQAGRIAGCAPISCEITGYIFPLKGHCKNNMPSEIDACEELAKCSKIMK